MLKPTLHPQLQAALDFLEGSNYQGDYESKWAYISHLKNEDRKEHLVRLLGSKANVMSAPVSALDYSDAETIMEHLNQFLVAHGILLYRLLGGEFQNESDAQVVMDTVLETTSNKIIEFFDIEAKSGLLTDEMLWANAMLSDFYGTIEKLRRTELDYVVPGSKNPDDG